MMPLRLLALRYSFIATDIFLRISTVTVYNKCRDRDRDWLVSVGMIKANKGQ